MMLPYFLLDIVLRHSPNFAVMSTSVPCQTRYSSACCLYVTIERLSKVLIAASAPAPTAHRIMPREARSFPELPTRFSMPMALRVLMAVSSRSRASRIMVSISTSLAVTVPPGRMCPYPDMK